MPEITRTKAGINQFFYWISLFICLNITFSWFSPGWTDKIGDVLIGKEQNDQGSKKKQLPFKDIRVKEKDNQNFVKGRKIEVKTTIKSLKAQKLKQICDKRKNTKVSWNKSTQIGDFILLNYDKVFKCKSISFTVNNDAHALVQISSDGFVFNSIARIQKGSNE
ncbi:MAG: hypothetical protein HRT88_21645, partial [Lentisphaeraceae bacterium]|nr:hypothetical protein [Lentisphaeraceae bacterium]